MKTKYIISLLVVISAIGGTKIFFAQPKVEEKIAQNKTVSVATVQERPTLKNSRYTISDKSQIVSTFPAECQSALVDLSTKVADEYTELMRDRNSFITFMGDKCFEGLKNNLTFKNLLQNSNCNLFEEDNSKLNINCAGAMLMLKAYTIAESSKGKNPNEMDSQELAAHFAKMFFGIDKLTKENFLANLNLINTLYDRHHDDENVQEAYLGYLMVGKEITKENSVDSKIDQILEENKGKSFKVDRMLVLREALKNKMESAKEVLDTLNERYPTEPDLAYYYSSYYWKQGNKQTAVQYLDKAINLCNHRQGSCTPGVYQQTKQRMNQTALKDGKIYSISIGLNFDNL